MVEPSIGDILGLISWTLDDKSDTKDRFREFLLKDKWQPEHFEAWIRQCVGKGNDAQKVWYRALQDVVVAVGRHLGFCSSQERTRNETRLPD